MQYDFILIDPPPTMGLINVNALVAADALIIPALPHHYTLEGLRDLLDDIKTIEENLGSNTPSMRILPTIVDRRNASVREIIDLLREQFRGMVFSTEIPINIKLAEAPSHQKTIAAYAPTSTGCQAYGLLAEEMLKYVNKEIRK
jgi:chromosome partitioning protein